MTTLHFGEKVSLSKTANLQKQCKYKTKFLDYASLLNMSVSITDCHLVFLVGYTEQNKGFRVWRSWLQSFSLTQLEIVVSFLILVSLPVKTVLKLPLDIVIFV